MPLLETLVVFTGPAIAKAILKLWLRDSDVALDTSLSLVDILKGKTSDILAQNRANRQFESIGEQVAQNLHELFMTEGRRFDEGSRTAIALAVANTLDSTVLTAELLVRQNLDPTRLSSHLLLTHQSAVEMFTEAEIALYRRIISVASEYIVDIAAQLPNFTTRTFAEILKRQDRLLSSAEEVLKEVQRIQEGIRENHPNAQDAGFEIDYRRAVRRSLDNVELFGADLSAASRRYRLSVAYVALTVKHLDERRRDSDSVSTQVSVNELMASSRRLFIRGQAGSGKTTLLKWMAVNSASRSFDKRLDDWNNTVPFYIRLRDAVSSRLPAPEYFPGLVAPSIAGTAPGNWTHRQMQLGRAIVFVDGVDEVPEAKRDQIRVWLQDLMDTFPEAYFVVTSRPTAVAREMWRVWLNRNRFEDAELQPMQLSSIYAFVDHWHSAVREELQDAAQRAEMAPLSEHLKATVRDNLSIRSVATNPLLCAMLCALHRDRRRQIPSDRIELYEACVHMLLERREVERQVSIEDYPVLTYRQKALIVRDLAYWFLQNGWSEVSTDRVERRIQRKLEHMRNLPDGSNATNVRRLFVDRSGLFLEPVPGAISFTHRTFQEFFAAQAVWEEEDMGKLVRNAHDDQWRDVVILAAGLAPSRVRGELISGLIKRGDEELKLRHQLHLTAVACLETATDLDPAVAEEVETRLKTLVPPKDMMEARALASAGQLALPHLIKYPNHDVATTAACIHALALISGEQALNGLKVYVTDNRDAIVEEMTRAWDYFDRTIYAREVLALANYTKLRLATATLEGIQYLSSLGDLDLSQSREIADLAPLQSLKRLERLDLSGVDLRKANLGVLGNLRGLKSLRLKEAAVSDADLFYSNKSDASLEFLSGLSLLSELDLGGLYLIGVDLKPLLNMKGLERLDLSNTVMTNMVLQDALWTGVDLSDAELSGANLKRADLSDADLSRANLQDADLSDANLAGADLSYADLERATLDGAIMTEAILHDARLVDADLVDVNLRYADLTNANLCGADLSDADLYEAELGHVEYDYDTILPSRSTPKIEREKREWLDYYKPED